VLTGSLHREITRRQPAGIEIPLSFRPRQVMAGPESETQLDLQTEFAAELQHQTKTVLLY
jgi:hypothetical protein